MSNYYIDLTPSAFRKKIAEAPIAYLPLGTLEWHSEHLPLGTDGIISGGFFNALADRVGGIVLPMLFLGPDRKREDGLIGMDFCTFDKSDPNWYEDRQLDGSAYWIPDNTYLAILHDAFAQLARAGFKVVLAHGHGPSTRLYTERLLRYELEFGIKFLTCHGADENGLGIQTDHFVVNETSLVMDLRPELVDMSALSTDPTDIPVGIWGDDPRGVASPEIGERAIASWVDRMETEIRAALSDTTPRGLLWTKTMYALIAIRKDRDNDIWGDPAEPPADPSKLRIALRLLSIDGNQVCIQDEERPNFRNWISAEGQQWPVDNVKTTRGQSGHCHRNCAILWKKSPDKLSMILGYALSDDGMWRQHTFLIDKQGPITETTTPRPAYYGVKVDGKEAQEFYDSVINLR